MNGNDLVTAIEQESPHLYRYALTLTHDPDDAEDLVQDCLERALARRSQYLEGTQLRRWLFTILRNRHIDQWRRSLRRGTHLPLSDQDREVYSPPAHEWHVALKDVARRFRRLRPCDQEVVWLSVFGGLKHEAIAVRMNVSVGTVKSRLSRARRQLDG